MVFFNQSLVLRSLLHGLTAIIVLLFTQEVECRLVSVRSGESISDIFDQAIGSLQRENNVAVNSLRSVSYKENCNELNNYIGSLVNSLNTNSHFAIKNKHSQFNKPKVIPHPTKSVKIVSKSKPKDSLNMSLDVVNKNMDISAQDFYTALDNFKKNRDFGQLALQHVIDLLDAELNLVRHLTAGHTGSSVEAALDNRNALLQRTIPVAVTLYDTILTLATQDTSHNATLSRHMGSGKRLPKALTAYDQKIFLSTIENKIEQYQNIIRTLQYHVGIESTLTRNFHRDDEQQKVINRYM